MTYKPKSGISKRSIQVTLNPSEKPKAPDAKLIAYITAKARENKYNPDEDPVVKSFRKQTGWKKRVGSL